MRFRGRMLALALAGAVVLASGAYAAGTMAGGGSATAKDDQDQGGARTAFAVGGPDRVVAFRGGPPPGFDDLADKLGVDADKLESALKDLRDELVPKKADRPKMHRGGGPGLMLFGGDGDFAEELADELGVEKSKIDEALDNIREKHEAEMERKRDEFAQKLADKLGISVDKVKEAFADGPFGGPPPPFPRHP